MKSFRTVFVFKRMNFDQNSFLFYCCKNVTVPFHCDCALVVQKMFGKTSFLAWTSPSFSTFYLGAVLYYCWDVFHFISFPLQTTSPPLKFPCWCSISYALVAIFINSCVTPERSDITTFVGGGPMFYIQNLTLPNLLLKLQVGMTHQLGNVSGYGCMFWIGFVPANVIDF